jgi:hypothetical protein
VFFVYSKLSGAPSGAMQKRVAVAPYAPVVPAGCGQVAAAVPRPPQSYEIAVELFALS